MCSAFIKYNNYNFYRLLRKDMSIMLLGTTLLVAVIYAIRKLWQEFKKKNLQVVIVTPFIVQHNQPNINNVSFNPNILKPKLFIFTCLVLLLVCIVVTFIHSNMMDRFPKFHQLFDMWVGPLFFSFAFPLYMYVKNPSLRNYVINYLKNVMCCC